MDLLEDEKESPTMEELGERIYTAHNIFPITTYSPFADTMVQLRASMDRWSRTLRYTVELRPCKRSSRLSRRRCILGLTGSLVTDSIMTTWLNEFDFQKANKAVINTAPLPFGWNDSLRIFFKVMKVLVECLRSPDAGDQRKMHKLQSRSKIAEDQPAGHGASQRGVTATAMATGPEASSMCGALPVSESGGASAARLYLREIHFGLRDLHQVGVGGQGDDHTADVERCGKVVDQAACSELVECAQDWEEPRQHGRLWADKLRHLHITHLELKAVCKTVLWELTGKVVRLYCDNQAVVAMLSYFTSRNPELMRHMRCLRILLDLNDIELQASADYGLTRIAYEDGDEEDLNMSKEEYEVVPAAVQQEARASQADVVVGFPCTSFFVGRVSRELLHTAEAEERRKTALYGNVSPHRLVPFAVKAFRGMGVQAKKFLEECSRGSQERLGPEDWEQARDALWVQRSATDSEEQRSCWRLSRERGKLQSAQIICTSVVSELTDETADVNGENVDCGGDCKENKCGGAVENFLTRSLCERRRSELGQSRFTDLAVKMQQKALLDTTLNNYGPKARRFIHFCEQQRRPWLPATEATVLL
eukprot:gene1456-biopygen1319